MQNVEWTIIVLFAIVWKVILEMHSQDVLLNHVRLKIYIWSEIRESFVYSLTHALIVPVLPPKQDEYRNPCQPSPCGPYSQCRDYNGSPSCSCLSTYIGSPPNCHPECSINSECSSNKACINEKCRDPCPGSCGLNAKCNVINHISVCTCSEHDTGDPFTNCYPKPPRKKSETVFKSISYMIPYL